MDLDHLATLVAAAVLEAETDNADGPAYAALLGYIDMTADGEDAHATLRAQLASTTRELERWRHDQQIEGDYVCPYSLALEESQAEMERLRAALIKACGMVDDAVLYRDDADEWHAAADKLRPRPVFTVKAHHGVATPNLRTELNRALDHLDSPPRAPHE